MANKALARRQKLVIRLEPSQRAPRNPYAVAAKQRAAGPHKASNSAQRQAQQRLLKAKLKEPEDE